MTEVKLGKDAITLPVGTEAERPANPVTGMIRWNTDIEALEGYDGVKWAPISDVPISATGGTVSDVTIGGFDFRIHAFTSTGTSTFEVVSLGTTDGEVDVLVVGGGGSGGEGGSGSNEPGGGGAGELYFEESRLLSPGSYSIIVGEGGAAPTGEAQDGNNGGDSSFDNITVLGGGFGSQTQDGGNGGSGGGGRHSSAGGSSTATIGFGNDGGDGTSFLGNPDGTNNDGGGGGGAADPGNTDYLCAGGDGLDFSSTFGTSFGDNGAFAGGGHGFERSDLIKDNDGVGNEDARSLGGGGLPNGWDIDTTDPREQGSTLPPIQNTGSGSAGSSDGGIRTDDGANGIVLVRYRI